MTFPEPHAYNSIQENVQKINDKYTNSDSQNYFYKINDGHAFANDQYDQQNHVINSNNEQYVGNEEYYWKSKYYIEQYRQNIERLKNERETQLIDQCTFKPKITEKANRLFEAYQHNQRLEDYIKRIKHNKDNNYKIWAKINPECTFHPECNKFSDKIGDFNQRYNHILNKQKFNKQQLYNQEQRIVQIRELKKKNKW